MSIIKCPECGKEISDKSKQCINCGYPICNKEVDNESNERTYKLNLKDCGSNKVSVIKLIREITGLGLVDAKALTDILPSCILSELTYDQYKEYEKKFTELGAIVYTTTTSGIVITSETSNSASNTTNTDNGGMGFWGIVGAIIVAVLIISFC